MITRGPRLAVWVVQLPESLIRGHDAFVPPLIFPAVARRRAQRHGDGRKQPIGHLEVALIARLIEGNQNLVDEPALIASAGSRLECSTEFV